MAKRLSAGKSAPAPSKAPKAKANGKSATASAAPSVGHNSGITREMTLKAHEELSKLEGALETAKGRLQQKWKDLKEQGHDIKALKHARRDLREDPMEQQATFDQYLQYREYLDVQSGVDQARQEQEREANAASIDAAERTKTNGKGHAVDLDRIRKLPANNHLRAALADGLRAGLEGEKCEHGYEKGSEPAAVFEAAHKEGLEQRASAAKMDPAHA